MTIDVDFESARLRELVSELGLGVPPLPVEFDVTAPMDRELEAIFQSIVARSSIKSQPAPRRCRNAVPLFRRRSASLITAALAVLAVTLVFVGSHLMSESAAAQAIPMLDFQYASGTQVVASTGIDPTAGFNRVANAARAARASITAGATTQHVVTDTLHTQLAPLLRGSREDEMMATQAFGAESWLAADGSFRRREVRSAGRLDVNGRLAIDQAQWTQLEAAGDDVFPPGEYDPLFVAHLSLDPATLKAQLLDFAGTDLATASAQEQTAALMNAVTYLQAVYVVNPQTRAAMWEVLATMSGIRSLGSVIDRNGREGIAFSYQAPDDASAFRILIIATADGSLLGTENLSSDPAVMSDGGAIVTSFTSYLSSQWILPEPMPTPNQPASTQ